MAIANASLSAPQPPLPPQQYSAPRAQNFITPAMWQESVASVYESGALKRHWDYDSGASMTETMNKRR